MSATPDRILHELTDLWVNLGKEGQNQAGGVLRACTMTLAVFAEEREDLAGISETVAALMPEHPARTILVRLSEASDRALANRVYAQCWMPFGQRRQICCEHIEITASYAALGDLPAVLLPLAAADLPLMLWCRSPRLAADLEFPAISRNAHKLVLDTAALPGLPALEWLAARPRGYPIVADLAWTRLTRWREMLAQVFENREYLAKVQDVARVRLAFSETLETTARYFAAWIAESLSSAGAKFSVSLAPHPAAAPLRLEIEGEGLAIALERRERRLVSTVNGAVNCTNLPEPSDYLLLREELAIVRRDPGFERALDSAVRLAYPVEE